MNEGLLAGVGSGVAGVRGRFAYTYVISSQTVNGPPWAKYVSIFAAGGGGGGGGGRYGITTNASGGAGGGAGGSRYIYRLPMAMDSNLNAKRWVCTIAAGGSGGAGSTSDGTNGTTGTSGGVTQVTFAQMGDASSPRVTVGINGNGGSGGGGGATGNPGGGSGGSSEMGQTGGTGGNGSTGTSGNQPTSPANSTAPAFMIQGGQGAPGKNSQNIHLLCAPFGFGSAIGAATASVAYSRQGDDAELAARQWFFSGVDSLVRAPYPFELWFITTPGGQAGTGSDTTTSNIAGNGGKGWNGSGGGGGGGSGGSAGAGGGTGGAGGNGFALFFWEEF